MFDRLGRFSAPAEAPFHSGPDRHVSKVPRCSVAAEGLGDRLATVSALLTALAALASAVDHLLLALTLVLTRDGLTSRLAWVPGPTGETFASPRHGGCVIRAELVTIRGLNRVLRRVGVLIQVMVTWETQLSCRQPLGLVVGDLRCGIHHCQGRRRRAQGCGGLLRAGRNTFQRGAPLEAPRG